MQCFLWGWDSSVQNPRGGYEMIPFGDLRISGLTKPPGQSETAPLQFPAAQESPL